MKTTSTELPKSLKKIIAGIENEKNIDCSRLLELIKQNIPENADYLPFNKFEHPVCDSYGRNNIYEGKNFSIYIMSWAPGDFTAIHSHGLSDWGAVYFFSDINHRLYTASGNKVELAQKGIVPAGTIVPVSGDLVHAMGNLGKSPVITLHIYGLNQQKSNANDNSFVYEMEKKQIRTTDGSAYINIREELCKRTDKGIVSNAETVKDYFEIISSYYRKNKLTPMVNYIQKVLLSPELYTRENSYERITI
jgi:predicted metal-dependent enzyme (double-stranded beta helix superfamily)